jgi:hypothetical protein
MFQTGVGNDGAKNADVANFGEFFEIRQACVRDTYSV